MNALGVSGHFFLSCRPAGVDVIPFDPETMAVRYCDKSNGKGQLHNISRHAGPKVQSETDKPNPQPQTATARHEQLRRDERIGNHALKIPASSSSTISPPSRRPVAADLHVQHGLTLAATCIRSRT
jgi:hypothetical protein